MRIVIDIRSTLKQKTGIGYYTLNLINNLAKVDLQNRYYLYSKIKFFNPSKNLPNLPGKNFKHLVNRLGIKSQFFLRGFDIIHTSSYDLVKPKNSKLVLVIHDVIHKIYPQFYTSSALQLIENNLILRLKEADFVIVDSKATEEDLLKFYGYPKEKIKIIYPAIEEIDIPKANSDFFQKLKSYNIKIPFILYVGTLEPRKNVPGLLKAYKILKDKGGIKHKLVIAGMKGWLWEDIFILYQKLDLKDDVIFTGYLPRQVLMILYKTADIFVYPSFYEGAGLPILEAFSFGLPVITSASSAMQEIADDCALLINPYSPEDIAEAMYTLINNQELKENLKQKALNRIKNFSCLDTARQTLEIFKTIQ